MADVIETERLLLRPFLPDDVEAAHTWFGNQIVMRYTPAGPDSSVEHTRQRLVGYQEHQRVHGFSKWLISESKSGHPIGDAGLLVEENLGWIDLGFRLAQAYWGRGLATEAASAWVRRAFGELGLHELGAFTHPENTASIRILEKLGFRMEKQGTVMGMPSIYFILKLTRVQGGGGSG